MDITFCKGIMKSFAVDINALITLFDSFHLCTYNNDDNIHCGGESGGPLVMVDDQNYGRYNFHWQESNKYSTMYYVYAISAINDFGIQMHHWPSLI